TRSPIPARGVATEGQRRRRAKAQRGAAKAPIAESPRRLRGSGLAAWRGGFPGGRRATTTGGGAGGALALKRGQKRTKADKMAAFRPRAVRRRRGMATGLAFSPRSARDEGKALGLATGQTRTKADKMAGRTEWGGRLPSRSSVSRSP